MRRRIVRPNTRSFTGRHVLPDGTGDIRFESGLERDFLTLLSMRDDVREIVEQPFVMELPTRGDRLRRYTPDFQVSYIDRTVVYEVKYREQLRKLWPDHGTKFLQARAWARERGIRFCIVTELTIRTARFENARLLAPYLGVAPDPGMASAIVAALSLGPRTVLDLVQACCPERPDRARFYAALWPMLANRVLKADLGAPIGMDLVIEAPQ